MTPPGGSIPRYRPGKDPRPTPREAFEIAAGAVLTQNTAWTNVMRAIDSLIRARALSPERIRALPRAGVARLIRASGYFRVKAERLANLAAYWDEAGGARALARRPTEVLREELRGVSGVGPETAESILAYALHRPTFVVDAYTRRIFERHGLAQAGEDYDALRGVVEEAFIGGGRGAGRTLREFHAHLVEVGKIYCRPRTTRCEECPLAVLPFAPGFVPPDARA